MEATIGPYFQVAAFTTLFSVVEKMLVRTHSLYPDWQGVCLFLTILCRGLQVWDPDERISAREAAETIA